jgi:hypothetical protein
MDIILGENITKIDIFDKLFNLVRNHILSRFLA